MIIESGHPLYDKLMQTWKANGGNDVRYGGNVYLVVKDNAIIRFSLRGGDNPFSQYGETTFR